MGVSYGNLILFINSKTKEWNTLHTDAVNDGFNTIGDISEYDIVTSYANSDYTFEYFDRHFKIQDWAAYLIAHDYDWNEDYIEMYLGEELLKVIKKSNIVDINENIEIAFEKLIESGNLSCDDGEITEVRVLQDVFNIIINKTIEEIIEKNKEKGGD